MNAPVPKPEAARANPPIHPGVRIGHVHLKVADLDRALAFYTGVLGFALMQRYASPFFILDEVDAALDKANTKKIVDLVKKYSKEKQFIVITHNDFTIQEADKVFGVSMEEGVSRVFGIEMPKKG